MQVPPLTSCFLVSDGLPYPLLHTIWGVNAPKTVLLWPKNNTTRKLRYTILQTKEQLGILCLTLKHVKLLPVHGNLRNKPHRQGHNCISATLETALCSTTPDASVLVPPK